MKMQILFALLPILLASTTDQENTAEEDQIVMIANLDPESDVAPHIHPVLMRSPPLIRRSSSNERESEGEESERKEQ